MTVQSFHAALWLVALSAILGSVYVDVKHRIIPNELAGLVAASGILLSLSLRPEQIWVSLLVGFAMLVLLGVFAHYGIMGGGDVKLIGATVLLVPPEHIGKLLVYIALGGGLLSCVYLLARSTLRSRDSGGLYPPANAGAGSSPAAPGWFSHECARIAGGGPMPYAVAIAAGIAFWLAGELQQCLTATSCSLWASAL